MKSFGCHIAFIFPWMRTIIFLCTLERLCAVLLSLFFAILNVFHTEQSTKNTLLLKKDNYLVVHEKPDHIAMLPLLKKLKPRKLNGKFVRFSKNVVDDFQGSYWMWNKTIRYNVKLLASRCFFITSNIRFLNTQVYLQTLKRHDII